MTCPKRIFLVFEGGGAKGIVHVGALRALDSEPEIEIAGVAGTSAGAIVAALVAAGYSARELVANDGTSPMLRLLGMDAATDFFGRYWDRLALARWAASDPIVALLLTAVPSAAAAWASARFAGLTVAEAGLLFIACFAATTAWIGTRLARGLSSLDLLVDKLDRALAMKLGIQGPVRFADFEARGRPLRIVATDVAARRLKIFSGSATPSVQVAEAVAASAALPIACSFRHIEGCRYIDGGIVSNLPAWTFDEERALDPDAITLALTIEAGTNAPANAELGPLGLMGSILRSAMFGRQHLETRAAPRLFILPLKTEIDVVDFDIGRDKVAASVDSAEATARLLITERLFVLPRRIEDACSRIGALVDALLDPAAQLVTHRTRVLLALRDPGAIASWRIQYGWNVLPADSDDQLLLPEASSVIGLSVTQNRPVLAPIPFDPAAGLSERKDRYRKALVRGDLKWCLAIPISSAQGNSDIVGVLAIDSDLALDYFEFDLETVTELAEIASDTMRSLIEGALKIR